MTYINHSTELRDSLAQGLKGKFFQTPTSLSDDTFRATEHIRPPPRAAERRVGGGAAFLSLPEWRFKGNGDDTLSSRLSSE